MTPSIRLPDVRADVLAGTPTPGQDDWPDPSEQAQARADALADALRHTRRAEAMARHGADPRAVHAARQAATYATRRAAQTTRAGRRP